MHVYTCTDTQKTGLFAEQAQFFDPRWTRTSFVASSSNPALCWSWMTLGFCVDGLVSPALGTTGLEDESTKNPTAAVVGAQPRQPPRSYSHNISLGTAAAAQVSNYLFLSAVLWKWIFSRFKSCLHAFPLLFWRTAILFSCRSLTGYVLAKGQILNTKLWWVFCFSCFSEGTCKPDKFSLQTKKL